MNERVPIIFALWTGLREVSGVISWAKSLVPGLRDAGYEPRIILLNPSTDPKHWGKVDKLIYNITEFTLYLKEVGGGVLIWNPVESFFKYLAVLPIVEEASNHYKVISVIHSDSKTEYYDYLDLYKDYTDIFIAVSPEIAKEAATRLGKMAEDRVVVRPCAVPGPRKLPPKTDSDYLTINYAGRLEETQKKVSRLPILCRELNRLGLKFKLRIAGTGSAEPAIRAALDAEEKEGKVELVGYLPPEEMPGFWSSGDIFLNVSDYEGTSVAMLEAMASGCVPVILETDSGTRGVIQNGENGVLIRDKDLKKMAEAIAEISRNNIRGKEMSEKARATIAERFSVESYLTDFFIPLVKREFSGERKPGNKFGRILIRALFTQEERTNGFFAELRKLQKKLNTQNQQLRSQIQQLQLLRKRNRLLKMLNPFLWPVLVARKILRRLKK